MSKTKYKIELTKEEIEEIKECLLHRVVCYMYHYKPKPTGSGLEWIKTFEAKINGIVNKLNT
jgi:hypothetical protein